jgi:hypothetical protein
MRYVFRRHLFLLIGLLTLCLFFHVAGLDRAGKGEAAHALAGPMRVLIVPMYLVWMVTTITQVAIIGQLVRPVRSGLLFRASAWPRGSRPMPWRIMFSTVGRLAAIRKVSASDSPDALSACLDASRKEGRSEEHPAE